MSVIQKRLERLSKSISEKLLLLSEKCDKDESGIDELSQGLILLDAQLQEIIDELSEPKTSDLITHGSVKSIVLEGVITRADGTVEDIGTLAHWDRDLGNVVGGINLAN